MLLVKHKQENLLKQIYCYHSKCLPEQKIEKQYIYLKPQQFKVIAIYNIHHFLLLKLNG